MQGTERFRQFPPGKTKKTGYPKGSGLVRQKGFSPGNGRKQMCGSVEPSPAALIRAAF